MKSTNKILQEYKDAFQNNKGKGYIRVQPPIEYTWIIFVFLISFLSKRPDARILIIVDEFDKRNHIINFIKYKCNEQNINADGILSQLVILTERYVNLKSCTNYLLIVTVDCYNEAVIKTLSANKFGLAVFNNINFNLKTELTNWNRIENYLNNLLPEICGSTSQATLMKERIYSPVKETRINCSLSDDDMTLYKKYEDYIINSMKIFGDIETVNKCRIGDTKNGISAIDFRYNLAVNNGWSTTLDCSIEYNKRIDEYFNPNSLAERAEQILNIIRHRRDLVSNCSNKFEYIKDIVKDNVGKKIIIVSKNGEYAKNVAEYLNKDFEIPICGEYHDSIEDSYFSDSNGEIITYKSGANKGKPKVFKSQAISTMWEEKYNKNEINVISIKESSNAALNIDAEIIIFTSSLLKNIFDFKARFNNVKFNANVTNTYRMYCVDTIEEKILLNEKSNDLIEIVGLNGQNLSYNAENDEIILQ